ncbi:uncharacterized protein si:ch211-151h10.2 [Clarias gariepinus]|uniref:uncharacterized protein si:ch211-151h10.2 n=1 Tax=Clarias gariepinus TaxID=13013 RepID=UPI00234C9309|nr:uncharacterized protein si:ch211-151h10.2 [Clarias gariepinus]
MDLRDLNGYRKGGKEGKKRGEDDVKMEDGVVDEQKWCWKNLQWGLCPRGIQCLAPVAALWLGILEEAPLSEVQEWVLLAGMLGCFLYQYRRQYKQKYSEKSEIVGKKTGQPRQLCPISQQDAGQQDAGHLLFLVRALLEGLVVSILQEPMSDTRVSQIQGLIKKLEAVSQLIIVAVNSSFLIEEQLLQAKDKENKEIKTKIEERVKHICTYLQKRVGALHFLLQIQDKYGVCIANIQQELQEYWEVLEDLHTKVTLQPKKCQVPEDPHTVLTDTEGLYTKLGLFQSRIHECQVHLNTSTRLLEELENKQQDLAQTVGLTFESSWTKDFLQCNTHQFKKVFKDFTSLMQQTLTFVLHLQDLRDRREQKNKTSDVEHIQNSSSSPSTLPVYSIGLVTENTPVEPDSELPNTQSSKFSLKHLLCGVKRGR